MQKRTLIYLASQSPRRKDIFKKLKIRFKVVKSTYDERMIPGLTPSQLVKKHSMSKALKAVVPKSATWVLGADTIVYCQKKILGKPKTKKEAFKTLKILSGRTHVVMTGLAFYNVKTKKWIKHCERSKVKIKKLSKEDILNYIEKVNTFDKAGAYGVQSKPVIVDEVTGSYSNVVGLPEEALKKLLKKIL